MKLLFITVNFLWLLPVQAQVGIGTTAPSSSAILDLTSITKGLLIPRMTTAQRSAISSPAAGLLVYDTDADQFYFYNGAAWTQAIGPAGASGTNGNTILNGTGLPSAGIGTAGDFYIRTSTFVLYGPKTTVWPGTGVSLIGPQGNTGSTGAQGPQGPQGPSGVANNFSIAYQNPTGVTIPQSASWTIFPVAQITITTSGAMVTAAVSVRTSTLAAQDVSCNLCWAIAGGIGTGNPINVAATPVEITNRTGTSFQSITVSGIVKPASAGTYWIGPCFLSTTDDLILKAVLGFGIIL